MRLQYHPLRFALFLLLAGILLHNYFVRPSDSKTTLYGFFGKSGGVGICQGRVVGVKIPSKYVVNKIRCQRGEEMVPLSGRLQIKIRNERWFDILSFERGDILRFRAYVRRPHDFRNFNRPVFETYYKARGISALGSISSPMWVVKIKNERSHFERLLGEWQARILFSINSGLKKGESRAFVRAVVLGDKSFLDNEIIEDLQNLGIVHLIVISGLHVAALGAIVWWLVILLGSFLSTINGQRDLRKSASFASLLAVWIFVSLTGFGLPAVRAAIIFSVYLASLFVERKHDVWDVLSFSAIILLLLNPNSLFDVSFQFTYSALIGIVVFSKYFLKPGSEAKVFRRFLCFISNLFIVSFGAFCGVLPLILFHFNEGFLFGALFSLVFSLPVAFFVVPVAVFASAVSAVSVRLSGLSFSILESPLEYFIQCVSYFALHSEWGRFRFEPGHCLVAGIYALIIAVVYWQRVRYKKILAGSCLALILAGVFMRGPLGSFEGNLSVTFLDVGQGASVLVVTPGGETTIIDGGGVKGSSFDHGENVIAPFLERMKKSEIENIFVTHPHPDHFKGLKYVVENFHPKNCFVPPFYGEQLTDEDISEWNDFISAVEKKCVKTEKVDRKNWRVDGVIFEVFSPPEQLPLDWNVNESSVVIKITLGGFSFLVTGDAEAKTEKYLSESEYNIKSTVLQVPHHGSETSTSKAFLEKVSPQYGVIQVGAFNKYGFPEKAVLERLKGHGVKIYRNDEDGAVSFVTNGEWLKVYRGVD